MKSVSKALYSPLQSHYKLLLLKDRDKAIRIKKKTDKQL